MTRQSLTLAYRCAGIKVALYVAASCEALGHADQGEPAGHECSAQSDLLSALGPETVRCMLGTLQQSQLQVQADLARSSAAILQQQMTDSVTPPPPPPPPPPTRKLPGVP